MSRINDKFSAKSPPPLYFDSWESNSLIGEWTWFKLNVMTSCHPGHLHVFLKTLESVSNNIKYHKNKSKTQIFSHLQSHQGLLDVHARSQEPKILQKAFSALFIRFLSSFHSKFSCHVTLLLFIFVLICCNNLKWSNLHEFVFLYSRI